MEFISERVSIDRTEGRFSVVISPRLSPFKRNLLVLWLLLWTLCGAYIFHARSGMPEDSSQRQYFLAFLAFWAYFELRMLRVVLWRLKGFELWRVKDGRLTVKDSTFGLGSANHYFTENIQQLGLLQVDPSSLKWQLNESPWVIGGERIGFEHLGKKVVVGKGLNNEEAKQLVLELKRAIKAR